MKKLLLAVVTLFVVVSCSLDDGQDTIPFHIEFVPAESVVVPEFVVPGQTYDITLKYRRPTDCYYVEDTLYSEMKGNQLIYALQATVLENGNCKPVDRVEPEEKTFKFLCQPTIDQSAYSLSFYSGTNDATGSNNFIQVNIPIQY